MPFLSLPCLKGGGPVPKGSGGGIHLKMKTNLNKPPQGRTYVLARKKSPSEEGLSV